MIRCTWPGSGPSSTPRACWPGPRTPNRCIRYLTKYLTKHVADCHQADTDTQRAHVGPARRRAAVRAVLADLRELAALRRAAEERPAGPAARERARARRTGPSTWATPGGGCWSPASGPARPSPTTAATARPGWSRPSAWRRPTRPGTPGTSSPRPTTTTCPTTGGCCTSSPTAPDGRPHSPKPDAEPTSQDAEVFRQLGGGGMTARPSGRAGGAVADRGPGRRAARHDRAVSPAVDRRAAYPVRPARPSCAHSRVGAARVHRGWTGRADRGQDAEEGRVMGNGTGRRRRFGAVRELKSGRWQARYRGPDGIMRPADRTFPSKTAAEVWLTRTEAEILNDDWIRPGCGPGSVRRLRGGLDRGAAEPAAQDGSPLPVPAARAPSTGLRRADGGRGQGGPGAPLAQEPARRWCQHGHGGEGVPAAQGHPEHGR